MKIFLHIGAILLAAVPCCAWAQQPQQQYGGTISGHVYCADTNAPARFARVTLMAAGSSTNEERGGFGMPTATGLDGSFVMQNVRPGSYYVTATMPGYVNPMSEVAFADLTSTDAAAQARVAKVLSPISISGNESAHMEIRLERGASLSGTIYYDDGSPAGNVMVQAVSTSTTSANSSRPDFGTFPPRTDDYGRYRVTGLPSGEYVVMAYAQTADFGGFGRGQQFSTLKIYAPKSFTAAEAKSYTLKAGAEVNGVDILIPLAAFHTVSGTAESSDGHTLNAGSLTLTSTKDKTLSFRGAMRSDGQFKIDFVPEGSYTLTLTGGAVTEPASGGRGRTTTVQSYGSVTQSVLVQSGDLTNIVLQVQAAQGSAVK